jgi:hypothetical protein
LIFLSTSPWSAEYDEIVAQVGHERIDAKVGDRIKDEVGKLLDKGGSREVGHVNNARLRRILWDKWEVEPGIWVSCESKVKNGVRCSYRSYGSTHISGHGLLRFHVPSPNNSFRPSCVLSRTLIYLTYEDWSAAWSRNLNHSKVSSKLMEGDGANAD